MTAVYALREAFASVAIACVAVGGCAYALGFFTGYVLAVIDERRGPE